jgi:hypothetical protein
MSIETPASVLRKFGLRLEGEPVDDGRIRRVPHDCRHGRDDAGWYVFHSHPVPHLAFGYWRCSPESHHWIGDSNWEIVTRQRLGGLLKFHHREAA